MCTIARSQEARRPVLRSWSAKIMVVTPTILFTCSNEYKVEFQMLIAAL